MHATQSEIQSSPAKQTSGTEKSQIPLLLAGSTVLIAAFASSAIALDLGGIGSIVNKAGGIAGTTSSILERAGVDTGSLKDVAGALDTAGQTINEANYYISQLKAFYQAIVGGNLWGILDGLDTIVGVLGIPDPNTATDAALERHQGGPQNPQDRKDPGAPAADAQTINSQIAHGITASVLGKEGQAQQAALQNQADTLTQQSWASASTAQSKNVTQDVIKETAKIQATQASLERIQSAQLLQLQMSQAAGNLMLENINGGIEHINFARLQEQDRQASLMQITGYSVIIPGLTQKNFYLASSP